MTKNNRTPSLPLSLPLSYLLQGSPTERKSPLNGLSVTQKEKEKDKEKEKEKERDGNGYRMTGEGFEDREERDANDESSTDREDMSPRTQFLHLSMKVRALHNNAVQNNMIQCSMLKYNAWQHSAVKYRIVQ